MILKTLKLALPVLLIVTFVRGQTAKNPNAAVEPPKCKELGPHWTTNYSCGALKSSGTLNTTTFCVDIGSDVPRPFLIAIPTFSDGSAIMDGTFDCINDTTQTVTAISYTASGILFDPIPPDGTTAGDFTSLAFVWGNSDDTNCSRIRVDLGSVSWKVVDTNEIQATFDLQGFIDTLNKTAAYAATAAKAASCEIKPPKISSTVKAFASNHCCPFRPFPVRSVRVEGGVTLSLAKSKCYIPGFSIPMKTKYAEVGLYVEFSVGGNVDLIARKGDCGVSKQCLTFGLDTAIGVGGGLDVKLPYDWVTCQATASGSGGIKAKAACEEGGGGKVSIGSSGVKIQVKIAVGASGVSCDLYSKDIDLIEPADFGTFDYPCLCFQ